MENQARESVKEYYGKVLKATEDLKTNACCTVDAPSKQAREALSLLHEDIGNTFYGCGSPIPESVEGCTVLDLGCGSGRDCFILSKLVGEKGKVIGLDMTDEQLDRARNYIDFQTEKFGYSKPNIEFKKGYIEDLAEAGIADNSIDIVISNCVINLSPNKQSVFSEIFRVLKPGGELYFSDVFADRRIPKELMEDQVLLGECLSGAMYTEDFRRMLSSIGCPDCRVIQTAPIEVEDGEIRRKLGLVNFTSITIRAFKLDLEDRCEDFGQHAKYLGNLEEHPLSFTLDDHHTFEAGRLTPVCGNTAAMLSDTRFAKHFEIIGDTSTHYGLFDCDTPNTTNDTKASGACC